MAQLDRWTKELQALEKTRNVNMTNKLHTFYKAAIIDLKKEIKEYVENYEKLSFSKRMEADAKIKAAQQVNNILGDLAEKEGAAIKNFVKTEARAGYYGTFYKIESEESASINFGGIDEKYIEKLTNKSIAGKTLSKRLYKKRALLANRSTTALMFGAVNGDGYAKVAKEIAALTEASYKQALRIARTEGGRVQSATKQDSYVEAEQQGIELEKKWLSTLDKRTRHSHAILDGQKVGVEEEFIYEGQKAAGPRLFGVAALDINCRCTTIGVVNGMDPDLRKDNESKKLIKYKNYKEWAEAKGIDMDELAAKEAKAAQAAKLKVINDKLQAKIDKQEKAAKKKLAQEKQVLEMKKADDKEYEEYKAQEQAKKAEKITLKQKKAAKEEANKQVKLEISKRNKKFNYKHYETAEDLEKFKLDINYNNWYNKLTKIAREKLNEYTGVAYEEINGYFREKIRYKIRGARLPEGFLDSSIEKTAKQISKAIQGSAGTTSNNIVYRTTDSTRYMGFTKENKFFIEGGFTSTTPVLSSDYIGAYVFGGSNPFELLEIELPKGTKGAWLGESEMTKHYGEKEFLLDRNTKFEFVSTRKELLKRGNERTKKEITITRLKVVP